MTDKLLEDPQPDGFSSESPLRAFTDWQPGDLYAIGKGFRPSVAHLAVYLSAIESKEGWRLLQVLYADDPHRMSLVFKRATGKIGVGQTNMAALIEKIATGLRQVSGDMQGAIDDAFSDNSALSRMTVGDFRDRIDGYAAELEAEPWKLDLWYPRRSEFPTSRKAAPADVPRLLPDDPINPKHYDGTACAEIGERLSANGYQVLKYCWRVGHKDDPCIELGKAVWYGEREYALITTKGFPNTVSANWRGLKPDRVEAWLEERIEGRSQFTQNIARLLWGGYDANRLCSIIEAINDHKVHLDCGRGLAV